MAWLATMTSQARRDSTFNGFSLIEVMIVIALLTIATSFVMPSFSRMLSRQEERNAEAALQSSITELRARAYRQASEIAIDEKSEIALGYLAGSSDARFVVLDRLIVFPDGDCTESFIEVSTGNGYRERCRVMRGRCKIECSDKQPAGVAR